MQRLVARLIDSETHVRWAWIFTDLRVWMVRHEKKALIAVDAVVVAVGKESRREEVDEMIEGL